MKKMKLNLNDLKIDSFETLKLANPKGTVVGNYGYTFNEICSVSCPTEQNEYTCFICDDTILVHECHPTAP